MMKFRAALGAALIVFWTGPLDAEDVTLTSRDGSIVVSGELLSFDGEFFRIDSDFGVLTLDGAGVDCGGPGCPDLDAFIEELTFSGASSMGAVLMPALVESFAVRSGFALSRVDAAPGRFVYRFAHRDNDREAARFHFRLSNPAEGFADLLAEAADVVISTREVAPREAMLAREAGVGDLTRARHARIIALDALVPLVHVSNRVGGIAVDDLARMFAGQATNWSALGGPDWPVVPLLMDPALGFDEEFVALALAPERLALAADIARRSDAGTLAAAVAADPSALGLGLYSERGNAEAVPVLGPCGAAVAASPRTLKTEDYPLTAPLFVYTPTRRLPRIARAFLAYATSPAAQPVVRRAGFVDQRPEEVPIDAQGLRLAHAVAAAGREVELADLQQMLAALSGMARLTVTFRFEGGSSVPDAQSRSNVELLAESLQRGVFDGRRLLFAGFSDGQGPAATNRRLALERAQAVRDAVLAATPGLDPGRVILDAAAFGEAMPMACDDTAWGRGINRRVEVWIQ